jgi:hypothetical protein
LKVVGVWSDAIIGGLANFVKNFSALKCKRGNRIRRDDEGCLVVRIERANRKCFEMSAGGWKSQLPRLELPG